MTMIICMQDFVDTIMYNLRIMIIKEKICKYKMIPLYNCLYK